jgi:hypothetical protein
MNRKDLSKLTVKWYKKLKRSGFEDIEWLDVRTGYGQNTPYLKDSAMILGGRYSKETETHYRVCQNFCTHHIFTTKKAQFIFQEYTKGITFREILHRCKRKGGHYAYNRDGSYNISLFTIHHTVQNYIKLAYEWNKTDPEGILHDMPDLEFQLPAYVEPPIVE